LFGTLEELFGGFLKAAIVKRTVRLKNNYEEMVKLKTHPFFTEINNNCS